MLQKEARAGRASELSVCPSVNHWHYVFCTVCTAHPDVVKMHAHKNRIPAIATTEGTIYRKETVADHLQSLSHAEAQKCARLSTLDNVRLSQGAPMDKLLSNANEALGDNIGSLMITVYNDAKRLTLSGNSWPSRVVAGQRAANFRYNTGDGNAGDKFDLNYVTPANHRSLMKCIVETHAPCVLDKLVNCRAMSLRLDGSVDRTQMHKIYVLAQTVTDSGDAELVYIGVAEPDERGAVGIVNALKTSLKRSFGDKGVDLLNRMSSVVTDGASVNIGEKAGLWALLQRERLTNQKSCNFNESFPLLTVWCAVHRSQLAWVKVSDSVGEVKHLFKKLIGISSYFHTFATRTREVTKLATEKGFSYVHMPAVYEVRWTEFSYSLVNAVLVSWAALVSYFGNSTDTAAKGHLDILVCEATLHLLAFLADILLVFSRFQQRLQCDTTTIVDMQQAVRSVQDKIASLNEQPLIGGWQETLQNSIVKNSNGDVLLRDVTLHQPSRRRDKHHLYVTDKRDKAAVCNEISRSLVEFLRQCFSIDEAISDQLAAFVHFDTERVDLRAVHKAIATDLDISELSMEFEELAQNGKATAMCLPELVKSLVNSGHYPNVLAVLCRILATKPHLADVERTISANNLLKTSLRSSLNIDTESSYIFIHHNLPCVADWDPRPSVLHWLVEKRRQCHTTNKG